MALLVDPFIPTRTPRQPLKPIPTTATKPRATPRPHIEQFVPSTTARAVAPPKAAPVAPKPTPAPPIVKKTFTAPVRRTSRLKSTLQLTALVIWALTLGLGTYLQVAGEAAIVAYGIVALYLRLSSRISFALALCAFAAIAILQVVSPTSDALTNLIIYAFLLLVVGSISLGLEIRQQTKWTVKRARRGRKIQRK